MILNILYILLLFTGYQPQAHRIGYTTQYSNGQFNSSIYHSQDRRREGSSNNRPRRVRGYTVFGDSIGDNSDENQKKTYLGFINGGSWNFWDNESEYTYYFDGKRWWRVSGTDGSWEVWKENSGFLTNTYYDWISEDSPPDEYIQGFRENPMPLEDDHGYVMFLILSYVTYQTTKRHKKVFF